MRLQNEIGVQSEVAQSGHELLPIRVLVVEDNKVNQLVAVRMLRKFGCTVETASDGIEALNELSKQSFDIVLMDCQMPRMDGYEATRIIRLEEKTSKKHQWITAMTANAMVGDDFKCYEAGMDDYLAKPVTFADLKSALLRGISVGLEAA